MCANRLARRPNPRPSRLPGRLGGHIAEKCGQADTSGFCLPREFLAHIFVQPNGNRDTHDTPVVDCRTTLPSAVRVVTTRHTPAIAKPGRLP